MGNHRVTIIKVSMIVIIIGVIAGSISLLNKNDGTPNQIDSDTEFESINPNKTRVTLMLDRYPNAMHAFIYTAMENGYFLEQGIDLKILSPDEINEGVTLVGLDVIQLALTSQPQVLLSRSNDVPVVSIASIVRHPLNYLMVPQTSSIQTPKNLEKRKVGYPGDGVSLAILKSMVRADDGDPDKVTLSNVKRDLVPAIASHRVDAIMGANINQDRLLLEARMQPVRTIEPMLYGVPEFYELVLITNENMVENNLELLQMVWKAMERGQQDVIDNPEQAVANVVKRQDRNFPLSTAVETESLSMVLPFMSNTEEIFGTQSKSMWSKVDNWLDETGLIRKSLDVDDAFVNMVK